MARRSVRNFTANAASASVAALALLIVSLSLAKADDVGFGRRLFYNTAQCPYCHGWAGDGAGEPQSSGGAADLRETKLTREQLIEVVSCGVPGKAMPRFDDAAYAEKRCYGGVTEAAVGKYLPPLPAGSVLSPREVAAVVDFLQVRIIGRGPITRGECENVFGAGARSCKQYPEQP
jgi:mono/diheme cytochrome c family protein